MKDVNDLILNWERQVLMEEKGDFFAQTIKFIEEFSELKKAVCKDNLAEIQDALGDTYISLISLRLTTGYGVDALRFLIDKDVDFKSSVINRLNVLKIYDKFLIIKIMNDIESGVIDGIHKNNNVFASTVSSILVLLNCIADQYKLSLKECVQKEIESVSSRLYEWDGKFLTRKV